ncbi:MAG: hypothetical protein ABEJ77_06910 [Halanaeroarchaeum sp.]
MVLHALDPATLSILQGPILQINPLGPPSESGYSALVVIVFAVIAAMGGGAFGAAIGALPAFIMTGFMVIAGAVATAIGVDGAAATMYAAAWGPLFGPHVGFQAGTAAAAYAQKYRPELLDDAKNILVPLGVHTDVLAVGAIFGAVGQLLKMLTDMLFEPSPWGFAHIAWVIVLLAFVHRAVFGYRILGRPTDEQLREAGESRDDGSRPSWFNFYHNEAGVHAGYQFYWGEGILFGALIGVIAGYVSLMTGSPWLPFGISAASLVFLEAQTGIRPDVPRSGTPITHQISLPAGVGALAAYGMNSPPLPALWYALLVAIVFGVLGEVFRLVADRAFYSWGETHVDPPAVSIVVTVFLLVVASLTGILGTNAFQPIGLHWF